MRQQWISGAKTLMWFSLIYSAVDIVLNRVGFSDGWKIVWPLNGVTIALLLKRPRSDWLWMLLGVELGTGIGECLDNNTLVLEIGQRLCSVTEVLLCAVLLPRFTDLEEWLRTPRVHARFFVALFAGPGVSGAMAALLFHTFQGEPVLLAFNNWATADALGIAATMPLALTWDTQQMRQLFSRTRLPVTLGVLLLAVVGSALIFSISRYPLMFLLFPLLLFVESFLAFAGTAIVMVAVCLSAVILTTNDVGPFGTWSPDLALPRDLALQLYFGFHVMALFPVSIMFLERRRLALDLRRSNARLTVLAALDGLTGMGNRRSFDERFEEEWERAVQTRAPLALVIFDLDNFKQYNDLYGHARGDECLRAVADVLKVQMRGPDDLAARFGGEEFAVLLPNTTMDGAKQLAERIRVTVQNLGIMHLGNTWNRVTVSAGYAAAIPAVADKALGLIQLADAALYRAKAAGRNCVETISSLEGLRAANDHFGDTTQIRLMRLLRRGDG
ncbi:MAG: diguanylate cyclase [Gammaproteobacteria bacterium]